MTGRQALFLGTSLVVSFMFWAQRCSSAEPAESQIAAAKANNQSVSEWVRGTIHATIQP